MDKIIKLNTVKDYNDFLGIETPHPLVSVIDASKISPLRHVRKNIGFYVVYLKDIQCADQIKYGRNYYDFQETVKYILNHPDIADIMAKNGHDYVCDNFAWDIMVEKYKRFFKELEEQHAK